MISPYRVSHVSRVSVAALSLAAVPACDDYTCQDTATCVFEDYADGGARTSDISAPESEGVESDTSESDHRERSTLGHESSSATNDASTSDKESSTSDNERSTRGEHTTDDSSNSGVANSPDAATSSSSDALSVDTSTDIDAETSGPVAEQCGDGVRQASEACDDGSTWDDDGCRDCTVVAGWRCSGAVGTESECVDIDECYEGTDNCDVNAACLDLDGSFECSCNEGYAGNGQSCQNVNECDDDNLNDCHADAICSDTAGEFTCECKPGFDGDGNSCVEEAHVTKLALGGQVCALISDGRVFCWAGSFLGNGVEESSFQPTPVLVPGIDNAVDVSVGDAICVVLANNTVKCWGRDDMGAASGVGAASSPVETPTTVLGLSSVSDVSATFGTSCAQLSNGTVRCFGRSDGTPDAEPTPVRTMSGLPTIARLGTSIDDMQCAVTTNGGGWCWTGAAASPSAVSGLTNVVQMAGKCALLNNGTVKCWGAGESGQIGNGSNDDQTTPQLVHQLSTATSIVAGAKHVCATLEDRSLVCWGKDGFFSPINYGNVPLPISGLVEVKSAFAGWDNTCAIEADHTVKCWGSNLSGQLGEGRDGNEFAPVVVHGLPGSE